MSNSGSSFPQPFPTQQQPLVDTTALITRPWLQLLVALYKRTGGAAGNSAFPSGFISDFAGPIANIPDGWLISGPMYSKSQYPDLFAAIQYTWGGSGDNFGTPPQDAFYKGQGAGQNVGDTGGSSTATLTVAQLPSHNHQIDDPGHTHVIDDPGHSHGITDPGHNHTAAVVASTLPTASTNSGSAAAGNTGTNTTGITVNTATTGVTNEAAMTGVTTEDTGSGDPVSILPPYAVVIKVVKI